MIKMRIEKFDLKSLESQLVNKKRLTTIFKEIDKLCAKTLRPLHDLLMNIEDYQYTDVMIAAINKIALKYDIDADSLFIAIREYSMYHNDCPVKVFLDYAYCKIELDAFLDYQDSFEDFIAVHREQTACDYHT